jgi:hypothetical protein
MISNALPTDAPADDASGGHTPDQSDEMSAAASDAGQRAADVVGALRATADRVSDLIPVVAEAVRDGARESARTIKAMPDAGQWLVAAFSAGLGVGLSVSGAPRIVVAATLVPAVFVASTIISRELSETARA